MFIQVEMHTVNPPISEARRFDTEIRIAKFKTPKFSGIYQAGGETL
jgi:hypothetical protein